LPRSEPARRLRRCGVALRRALVAPLVVSLRVSDQQGVIHDDLVRWKELRFDRPHRPAPPMSDAEMLRAFAAAYREFRTVFYFRLEAGNVAGMLLAKLARRVWRPLPTFDIACDDVGPGLVVRHGYSTILTAERIGANCFAHQGVTVGWRDEQSRPPVLGDDVYLGAGAKVLGPITLGDGVMVGANAVVIEDVPPGSTVAGVPARVVNKRDRTVAHREGDRS
jgi:serine O-acetyltransferase